MPKWESAIGASPWVDRALGPTVREPPSYCSTFDSVCRKRSATRRSIANTRSQALRGRPSAKPRKPGSPIDRAQCTMAETSAERGLPSRNDS
jgi:hypothetical protein